MSTPLLQVENSPFNPQQVELLNQLLPTLSAEQASWLGGYLAAYRQFAANGPVPSAPAATTATPSATGCEVTVLYGSQTGNAARLAGQVAKRLAEQGIQTSLSCMSEYKPSSLKKVKHLLVVCSTHGEGEAPDKAKAFHEFLFSKRAPKLEGAKYSVLALGDITYKQFCQTGREFDRRLEELGAARLYDRVDCDVDYRDGFEQWSDGVLAALGSAAPALALEPAGHVCNGTCSSHNQPALISLGLTSVPADVPAYDRLNPFSAEVIENINLNGRGSDKETRYLKLSLDDSGLSFAPGDSLGIYPENRPSLVDELIHHMGWRPDEPVPVGKHEIEVREALLQHYEITQLSRPLLEQAAAFSRDGLVDMVKTGGDEAVYSYIHGRDLLDLSSDFGLSGTPARDFVRVLRKLPPRLYSISSSHAASPDEVDVTVAAVRYRSYDRDRFGVCSSYCSERLQPGDRVRVYVNENPNFRMPSNPDAPVIMVGPGTGVAPFRAFLEEREEQGAAGKTWLFFGDRRFKTDFLYQTDWLRWRKNGVLTRMNVAFSRDIDKKVYVQHRMLEHARELYAWLQEGAYVYVCGDEKKMAPDVHAALETIVAEQGGLTTEAARAYMADLRQQNRYQRDVY